MVISYKLLRWVYTSRRKYWEFICGNNESTTIRRKDMLIVDLFERQLILFKNPSPIDRCWANLKNIRNKAQFNLVSRWLFTAFHRCISRAVHNSRDRFHLELGDFWLDRSVPFVFQGCAVSWEKYRGWRLSEYKIPRPKTAIRLLYWARHPYLEIRCEHSVVVVYVHLLARSMIIGG